MTTNLTNLSDKSQSSLHTSPEQALREALKDVGEVGALKKGRKVLILALDDSDGYSISQYCAGLKNSECVALLNIAAKSIITDIGY